MKRELLRQTGFVKECIKEGRKEEEISGKNNKYMKLISRKKPEYLKGCEMMIKNY